MEKIQWERDPNGSGYTGRIPGKWVIYVLNNGTYTIYPSGKTVYFKTGSAPSVISAKAVCARLIAET